MTRRKYSPKDYKRSNPGDPLTEDWTIREAVMYGKKRDVLIRKVDGKKQRRMVEDGRMSATISWGEAKQFMEGRSERAKAMDKSLQHQKQKKTPDKAWKNRPGRSDIKGIDHKSQERQKKAKKSKTNNKKGGKK